jgi:DNA-binding transcriptional ArsR family regulator
MRLIKPNNYDETDMKIAYLGDAISHPVRKRIIEHLFVEPSNTRTDFSKLLNLSKPVIGQHIQKLIDAKLIQFNYSLHFERIELKKEAFTELMDFLIDLGVRPSRKDI